jgi:hypothetical protein
MYMNCGMDGCGGPTAQTRRKQFLITKDKVTADGKYRATWDTVKREPWTGQSPFSARVLVVSPRLRVRSVAQETIRAWAAETAVEVTPEAQALILKGFEEQEQNGLLPELLAGPRIYNWSPNTLFTDLVREYLFELRDGTRTQRNRASAQSPLIRALQAGPTSLRNAITPIQIAWYPVADFLRTVARSLRGDVVSYRFISIPEHLDLYLDGTYAGSTVTEKVLSPKTYSVVMRPRRGTAVCEVTVTVKPGPPEEIRCPPEN